MRKTECSLVAFRPGTVAAPRKCLLIYETSISTVEDSPETAARIPQPQLQQKRPRYPAQSPSRRTQAADPRVSHAAPARLRFGRAQRIKQGRDFARVRQQGQRLVSPSLIANWRCLPADSATRLGVITSSKVGGAVARNRARRLLREAFRLHQRELAQSLDLVLVARPVITGKSFAGVEKDFLTTLRKAGLLK